MEIDNKTSKMHPLIAAAAIALILVCVVGVAAMLGILPNFNKNTAQVIPADSASANASGSAVATTNPPTPAVVKEEAPPPPEKVVRKKPVKKPAPPAATTHPESQNKAPHSPPVQACLDCGVVESVREVEQQGSTSGIGAGIGAVVGGVLGNQVGSGTGQTLATIAGAVGGGYAGNTIEKRRSTSTSYEVIVRMENGNRQRFMMNVQRWRSGDLVRVENGNLIAR